MKFTKIIALVLALISLLAFASCGKKVCDVCRQDTPEHEVKLSNKKKVELCGFCYQKAVALETDADVASIKETPFESLSEKQKNYIIIFTTEAIDGYDALNIDGSSYEEIQERAFSEAAAKYNKSVDQIKSLVAEWRAVKETKGK